MKKILSMILTLAMVLSLAVSMGITVSAAPEGTAINSAAEFAAMAADGKYYLAADITLDATYANEFTGAFDGNGKTVTITKGAMFNTVKDATIQNFTVKGDIKATEPGVTAGGSEDFAAAVVIAANGKTVLKNITSNVNYETTSANTRYGAIAATSAKDHAITIDGCVNNGNITVVKYAGGIYGWACQVGNSTIKNCTNNGNVTGGGYLGGIACRLSNGGEGSALTITNCVNNGDIKSTGSYAGGMLGYNTSILTITNCINNGDISGVKEMSGGILGHAGEPKTNGDYNISYNVNTGKINNDGTYTGGIVGSFDNPKAKVVFNVKNNINTGEVYGKGNTGGIIGYVYGSGSATTPCYAVVDGNVNTGKITSGSYCSQFLAYTNAYATTITNNIGLGSVAGGSEEKTVFVGLSSANIANYTIKNNYLIENDGVKAYSYANDDKNAHNRVALADKPADAINFIKADKVADAVKSVNTAIGENLYAAQNGTVVLAKTVTPTQTPATADASIAIVALLSVMTLAFVAASKKRVK